MPADIDTIASILTAISAPPSERGERRVGDLDGAFDRWFDGGAVREVTGWTEYHFANGTLAVVAGSMALRIDIRLPDGSYVTIAMQTERPQFFPA